MMDEMFDGREEPEPAAPERSFVPALDVSEEDGRYLFRLELPGTPARDVHVDLVDRRLVIHGVKRSGRREGVERVRHTERVTGSFRRAFTLPPDANPQRIVASFEDGVLVLSIQRSGSLAAAPRRP